MSFKLLKKLAYNINKFLNLIFSQDLLLKYFKNIPEINNHQGEDHDSFYHVYTWSCHCDCTLHIHIMKPKT